MFEFYLGLIVGFSAALFLWCWIFIRSDPSGNVNDFIAGWDEGWQDGYSKAKETFLAMLEQDAPHIWEELKKYMDDKEFEE